MADLQKQLPSVFMSLKATAAGEESCKQDSFLRCHASTEIITGQNVIAEKEEK